MLSVLLDHPDAWQAARAAAEAGDAAAMQAVVQEAGRLNPALSPGQWRYCPVDTEIEIDGRTHTIKAGTTLLVSTMSALRDPRVWEQPGQFRTDRRRADGTPQEPDLVFGIGPHWCLGKYLALAQIGALFTQLLKRPELVRAKGKDGKLDTIGPFPRRMVMTFAAPAAQQSMFLVLVPVADEAAKLAIDAELAKLGNPASAAIRAALDATGLVHFGSLTCFAADSDYRLSFELSVDGAPEPALAAIAAAAGHFLRPVFALAGLRADEDLTAFMQRHIVLLHGKPWGANGLNFNGLGEFPVERTARQARFADFAGRALRDYVANETARGSHPMLAVAHLRRILRGDSELRAEATPQQMALIAEARREGWDAFHLQTDATRLQLARFRPVSNGQAFFNFLKSRDGLAVTVPLLAIFAASLWLMRPAAGLTLGFGLIGPVLKAVVATALISAALVTLFLMLLRRAEKRDQPDLSQAPLDKLQAIFAQENPPGHVQNHILALGTMKAGWLRACTHAFALWGIRVVLVHAFRPGFVINMGTIHYARWWRVPGTRKVAFYSNFDGSWESYLEDFITRARQGQTATWSNWEGFPRTRFMMGLGAQDADGFKRWVRIQQQLVPFWYARFPDLSSEQIRSNALIHSGLGLARGASESEEWLRCFGSMPRTANRIETDEVQALVFRGMKRLRHSACLALRLPPQGEQLGEWLSWVRGKPMRAEGAGGIEACTALVAEGILTPVPRPAGRPAEYALSSALTVTYGDRPLTGEDGGPNDPDVPAAPLDQARAASAHAVFLALSAAGMARFEAPHCAPGGLGEGFPLAFRMGMAARSRVTGDSGASAPGQWRWGDDPQSAEATEAVLMIYATTPEQLERALAVHEALLGNHGGRVLSETLCAPAFADEARADFEHFGYRDGIAQPVISGTTRSTRDVPSRDLVEPGEFILGYANAEGYVPPSPLLPPEADVRGALPAMALDALSRFPDFGDREEASRARDLGRNGSYLVLRELKQDVAGYEAFVDQAAAKLSQGGYGDLYKLVGQTPDRDWVKAKLMGRWPSGRPLVGNPVNIRSDASTLAAETDNDFSFGGDDPHGLACPFGSHIRRTNPRDSKQPGDAKEQVITNRHRILRRGRTYARAQDGEKGLMFACLCSDIERQFEFVQQFWSNEPTFHGLSQEPDPIIGSDPIDPRSGCPLERGYTIPTVAGPIRIEAMKSFVQTMAGGYFFLPSRSALGWLTDTALHAGAPTPGATGDA
jgi:Dyp-type peroxidase family